MEVEIRPARQEDAVAIMADLREEDRHGIELLQLDGTEALKAEIERANCSYTGLVDGRIAVIWGVVSPSLLSGVGFLWMVTSKKADEVPFIFARRSQRELERILQTVPVLTGYCFAYNKRSLRWLEWLGAKIGGLKISKGIAQYPFEFRRN